MNKRTVNKPITKKTTDKFVTRGVFEYEKPTLTISDDFNKTEEVGTQSKPLTSESNLIDKRSFPAVFPLKFIEVPLDCFKRSSSGEIQHKPTMKQIEDILTDYKFHSFNASFNRGQIILCFEKK
jgi:hypothetical protein